MDEQIGVDDLRFAVRVQTVTTLTALGLLAIAFVGSLATSVNWWTAVPGWWFACGAISVLTQASHEFHVIRLLPRVDVVWSYCLSFVSGPISLGLTLRRLFF